MKLHTIAAVKTIEGSFQLYLEFEDDDDGVALVDLSPILAQGGVFEPLRDLNRFQAVQVGPRGRTLVWRVGENVVDLCADAMWLMAHPDADRPASAK